MRAAVAIVICKFFCPGAKFFWFKRIIKRVRTVTARALARQTTRVAAAVADSVTVSAFTRTLVVNYTAPLITARLTRAIIKLRFGIKVWRVRVCATAFFAAARLGCRLGDYERATTTGNAQPAVEHTKKRHLNSQLLLTVFKQDAVHVRNSRPRQNVTNRRCA